MSPCVLSQSAHAKMRGASIAAISTDLTSLLAIAVASLLGRQSDDGEGQPIPIGQRSRHIALRAPMLIDDPAGVLFREAVILLDAIDRLPASLGGYKFSAATSTSTCPTGERSATSRRN